MYKNMFVLILLASFVSAATAVEVPNPSFNIASIESESPTGWVPNPNGVWDAVFTWDTTFGRTDNFSLRISTSEGNSDVPLDNPGWITADFIPVEPHRQYEVSVFTFTPDGGVGHIPAVQFFTAAGHFIGTQGATGPSGIADPVGVWVEKKFTQTPFLVEDSRVYVLAGIEYSEMSR